MQQIDLKKIRKSVNDFFDGFYDTAVKAPISFGDFVARASGYRDYQFTKDSVLDLDSNLEQRQALNELEILYNAIKNETSRNIIIDTIINDVKERPAYYLSGVQTTNVIGKTFTNFIPEFGYKWLVFGAKIEENVHRLYEKGEIYIQNSEEKLSQDLNIKPNQKLQPVSNEIVEKLKEHIFTIGQIMGIEETKQFIEKAQQEENQKQLEQENKEQDVQEIIQEESSNVYMQRM